MNQQYLIGLDAGGSGGRCLLVNVETRALTLTARPWRLRPAPNAGAWGLELDLLTIWRTLGEITREALVRAGARPTHVLGLAATSMRHGLVLLDAGGRELFAVPNRDARATTEAMELAQERGSLLYARTGHWPAPILWAARLLWLARHAPEILTAARQALTLSDWLGFRLTGVSAAERAHAGETLLLELVSRNWAEDVIAELGLSRALFPPLADAGALLGGLTSEAAAHLGLPAGLPVAVGGADTQSALLGAGVLAPGQLAAVTGTTAPVQLVTARPLLDPQRRLWTGLHLLPDTWVLESNAGNMGEALAWVARLLYPEVPVPPAALTAAAGAAPPGAYGLSSTIGASIFNAAQLGLPVDTLAFSHQLVRGFAERPAVARAVLEGLAYALKANSAQLLAVAQIPLTGLSLSGGLARSNVWAQLLSDVLAAPVEVAATPETTALGAALCAGVAAGVYPNLAAAGQALIQPARRYTPNPSAVQCYRQGYADWLELLTQRAEADLTLASRMVETFAAGVPAATPPAPAFRPRLYVSAALDAAALAALRELGEVDYVNYRDDLRLLSGDDLVEALRGYHGFITEIDVVDGDILPRLPDLRVIGVCRGAPVNVDLAACTAHGIPVLNTPGRNAGAVADLTVAALLLLLRHLPEATLFLHEPGGEAGDMSRMGIAFTRFQGRELWRKTVGLIGLGAVGREVARRLLPFGARLLVTDPYLSAEQVALAGAEKVALEMLLAESDIISLHAPVTDETRQLLDAAAFAQMKPGALLLNTARAALVDEAALIEALRSGKLGGAALDVFTVEPPGADHPLLACPNVIATPHIGGNTVEVAAHQGQIIADDLARLLRGETPLHIRNPEALTAFSWTGPRREPEAYSQSARGAGPAVRDLETRELRPAPPPPTASSPRAGGVLAGFRRALGLKTGDRETPETAGSVSPPPAVATARYAAPGDQMTRLLHAFTESIRTSPAMRDFSWGKHMLMHFMVNDRNLHFYLNFQDGVVDAALSDPPAKPDVTLKMHADTLDGMFTGRINPTRAAMSGRISFSGDTSKAMAFQRLQKDMGALYIAASEAVGGPGDLSSPAPAAATPTGARLAPPHPSTSIHTGDVRDELLAVLNELYTHGLITATGGNLSARVEGQTDELWITPSQSFKGHLRPDMMVRINLDGHPLDPDALTPSSEWRVHTALYRRRPDLLAVVHTHAPQTILLGLAGKPFLPISTEAAFIGELVRVPFMLPGSPELAEAVAEALGAGVAVLMEHHGLVVGGSSLRRAANVTEIIEDTAQKILTCYMLGLAPATLPENVVAQLREIGALMA